MRAEHGITHKRSQPVDSNKEYEVDEIPIGHVGSSDDDEHVQKVAPDNQHVLQENSTAEEKAVTGRSEIGSSPLSDQANPSIQEIRTRHNETEDGVEDGIPRTRYGRKVVAPVRYIAMATTLLDMSSSERKYLELAYGQFKGGQFYGRQAPFVPNFILDKADKEELNKNWKPNMVEVDVGAVPKDSSIIGSHFVYKVKVEHIEDSGELRRS